MIFFGGIALFQYIAFAPKLYVYGNKIVIKKWYGLRRKYYVQDIDKVIFEKVKGRLLQYKSYQVLVKINTLIQWKILTNC